MALTAQEVHDRLIKVDEELEEIKRANVVDCSDAYLTLIKVRADLIRMDADEIRRMYEEAQERTNRA
jgi:hypothetical protein